MPKNLERYQVNVMGLEGLRDEKNAEDGQTGNPTFQVCIMMLWHAEKLHE